MKDASNRPRIGHNYRLKRRHPSFRVCEHGGRPGEPFQQTFQVVRAPVQISLLGSIAYQTRYLTRLPAEYSPDGSPIAFTVCTNTVHLAPGGNRLTLAPSLSLSLSDRRSIFADFLWGPCLPTFHSSWYRYVRATVCTILAKFVEPVILINLLSGTSVYFSTRKGSVSFLRVFQTRGYRFFSLFFFFFRRGLLRYINRWIIKRGSVCLTYI